ncbi:nuclear transport factor 2 family protein [Novosphingobium rosa]|uniref:nuclear transport factor 2 family protein n=1 Tax=Novosphingobium rosa TaxID=76978 RepID=UPI00082D20A6|nr:nuclear transport factor 2 family protein [Novosphingobium rosa]
MTMAIDERALQILLDKEAIRETSLRYTRGIDRHDDELMARAYHGDAIDDHGAYIGGPEGFIRHAGEGHARHWDSHHHYIMNQTIDLDGDCAHVETYFMATLRRKTGPIDMVGGRYIDRFERREGEWAVAQRACLVEWNGKLDPAEAAMDPDLFLRGSWDRSDPSYMRPLILERPHRDLGL